jgi:hypothetical protein
MFKLSLSVFLSIHNYTNFSIVILNQAAGEHNQLVSYNDDDDDDNNNNKFLTHIINFKKIKHGNMAGTEYEHSVVQQYPDLCLNHKNMSVVLLKREICQQLMAINCFLIVVLHEQLLQ